MTDEEVGKVAMVLLGAEYVLRKNNLLTEDMKSFFNEAYEILKKETD